MSGNGTKKQIVTNTLTGWGSLASRAAIALVMVPFLLNNLGKDGYGLIGLLGVIVSFSTVVDLGLRQALGRELSEKVANQDVEGFRTLSSTALTLYLGIATVLVAVGWIIAPWFATTFKVAEGLRDSAIWMIRLYGSGSIFFSFITPVITAGLQSFMRFDAVNYVQTISGIGAGILLFVFISFFNISPLIIWAVVMLSISLINFLILWAFYKRWCFSGKLSIRYLDWRELKPLFQLGGYMYVLQLTNAIAERSDPLVVSFFFGTVGMALYDSGSKISQTLRPVVLTLSTQVHPLTTRFHVLNQQDMLRKTLILGTRYTLLLGVVFSAGIFLFGEQFCRLWLFPSLGDDYLTVVKIMIMWAIANLFEYAAGTQWPVLLGMKKMRFALALQIPSAVFNIIFSIYLVGYTDWGITGVLVATIITGIIRRPIAIWYVSRLINLPVMEYLRSAYLPPGILLLLLMAFYYVLSMNSIQSWIMLFMFIMLFGIYTTLILLVIERRLIVEMWQQWAQR